MIRLMENTKKCTKCGRELPLDQFHKRRYKSGKEGRQSYCKYCKRELGAVRYQNNRAEIGLTTAKWAKNNPKKVVAKVVRWQKRNPDKVRAGNARYQKERKVSDLGYKIAGNTRAAMSSALSGSKKCTHTTGLLGCSIEYLRNYLESLFQPSMTWDNYGRYGWHIDHVIPLSHFDMSDPKQQKRAWHYTNLQPLWAKENMSKGAKIIERQLVLL